MTLLIFLTLIRAALADTIPATVEMWPQSASEENRQIQNQGAPQEGLRITVNASMVTTDVTVIGTAVSELRADDFIIYDNGVAQAVSYFSRDLLPLAVALVVDGSYSIKPYLPALQIASLSALRRLRPEDQVVLFSFAEKPERLSDLSEDRLLIARKINKLTVGSGTNIYDAIFDAARYLHDKAPRRRHAIILVSDNCHNVPRARKADSVRARLLETSATLYGIQISDEDCSESSDQVKWLASETGGEILDVQTATSLQSALKKATSNLRLQYTLGFSPSNPGENGSFHALMVKIATAERCPGCRLLARSGYYSGITAPLLPTSDAPKTSQDSAQTIDQLLIQRSIFTAVTTDLDLPDIPFTVKTSQGRDSDGLLQLTVDLKIDSAGIDFKTEGSRHACKLHVAVFYANENGKILGSDWKTIDGLLSDETYNRVMKAGIPYSTTVPIKAKKQILKIAVYDEQSDRVGSKLVRIPSDGK